MMNLNIQRSQGTGGGSSFAYSLRVGRIFCLLAQYPSSWKRGIPMDMRCPPNTLEIGVLYMLGFLKG
jgi:hypothetical protein